MDVTVNSKKRMPSSSPDGKDGKDYGYEPVPYEALKVLCVFSLNLLCKIERTLINISTFKTTNCAHRNFLDVFEQFLNNSQVRI